MTYTTRAGRRPLLPLLAAAAAAAACDSTPRTTMPLTSALGSVRPGTYRMAAMYRVSGQRIAVPGADGYAGLPADSVRYLGGEFVLGDDGRWKLRIDRVYETRGAVVSTLSMRDSGRFIATQRNDGHYVLDLLAGQGATGERAPTGLVVADTVFHNAFVYVR